MVTLFTSQTANGNSNAVSFSSIGASVNRPATVYVWGTFDSCTVDIQVSPDGSEWFPTTGGQFTEKGAKTVTLTAQHIRLVLASAGGSTSINGVVM